MTKSSQCWFAAPAAPVAALGVLLGLAVVSGQQAQPPGQFRPRPSEGREPQLPPPSIRDYKPRSTLVVPQHPIPRARFPVVDVHGHPPSPTNAGEYEQVVKSMDGLNLQVMVYAGNNPSERVAPTVAAIRSSRHADRMVVFTNISFREAVGPGFGKRMAAQLEADVKSGARGLGEIMKNFGLNARTADGSRLKVDDPELDPIWEACARLDVPAFIHTGDPSEFFKPLDYNNERWLEMALFPDRRYFDRSRYPSFDDLMAERDRLFARHPRTKFIIAHMGWHANDLGRLGALFDKMPNLYTELGAILYDLGRQPRAAREFFVKYQDRILFGKDSYQPDEYPYYWRVFETNDEYFDYYRDYHAFWKLYGMGLPDIVLKKVYYGNALKIVPGLPKSAFPPI
jgi:predicted TIM-barrel fold metal-dependent hydrolase